MAHPRRTAHVDPSEAEDPPQIWAEGHPEESGHTRAQARSYDAGFGLAVRRLAVSYVVKRYAVIILDSRIGC